MTWTELFLLSIGLSMDAFAVAVSLGLTLSRADIKRALIVGAYFGAFQAGMPVIGYIAAIQFAERIVAFDHWIVFALLLFLGGKMIIGSLKKEKCTDRECPAAKPCKDRTCPAMNKEVSLKPAKMLPLALATSIDALAVGISFAVLQVNIVPAVSLIGVVTLVISMVGVKIGSIFGAKFKSKAGFAGGVILILIGVNVLLQHFGVL